MGEKAARQKRAENVTKRPNEEVSSLRGFRVETDEFSLTLCIFLMLPPV